MTKFSRATALTVFAAAAFVAAPQAYAQMGGSNPMVGGAPMLTTRNIVENAVNSADHTTLVAAVQAAGLVETLQSAGPFTVFAPTNAAFAALPAGTVDTLLMPANKDALTGVLTYHVIPGYLSGADLTAQLTAANGRPVTVATVNGGMLTFTWENNMIHVAGAGGGEATVTIADVVQSNGVIHVIDAVLLP